ncbi:hypothetical protein B9Y63_00870 [Stenotrophomonas maltophilia]|nr:hypothetical protein B9Y63_00870 [Stenotrophomonas maltophilia]PJL43458.1 hypothetical protein B9Y56_01720 [Stenotrophomonas maltophilia]
MTQEHCTDIDPKGVMSEIERIQPSVVCFDYFDTLVSRGVHPEDVKRLWAEGIARTFPEGPDGPELYRQRNAREAAHCAIDRGPGLDSEFRASEVYIELWDANPGLQSMPRTAFTTLALDLEVSLELSTQQLDEQVVGLVRELAAKGIECWLVSDFYLETDVFQRFLAHHGLDTAFKRMFVSCDSFTTKRGNGMYARLLAETGIAPGRVLMIGDNEHADFNNARAAGLHAIHLDRSRRHAHYQVLAERAADLARTRADVNRLLSAGPGVFRELALTLHLFIDRLHARLVREGARDVFFLAREGQFLKRLFDHYQSTRQLQGAVRIRSHYLEVSRRATLLPSLQPLAQETFETLFRQYRRISLNDFLSSLGLQSMSAELAERLGVGADAIQDDLPSSEVFARLRADALFQQTYEQERLARRSAFLAYLNAFGADPTAQTLHLVDVGWKGTIQDNISAIVIGADNGLTAVQGHYIGLVASGSASARNRKDGLLFSCVGNTSRNFAVFNENRALFEVVLAADHGSALCYSFDANGLPVVSHQEFSEESLFRSKVAPLQAQLWDLFVELDRVFRHHNIPARELERLATRAHARMLLQPDQAAIEWFENVYHVENFGVFNHSTFDVGAHQPSFIDKLRFYLSLRRNGVDNLGFWPLLTCLQRGGRWVASRYASGRLRGIED